MNKNMEIWGRSHEIEIVFDCYAGEEILEVQKKAYEMFLENAEMLLESALASVENYCQERNHEEIGEDKISNIFKYVKPKTLFIKRTDADIRKVALICLYKFNPDDGLAIVFKNEKLLEIGTENIIL